jgi:hypothetical protein
MLTLGQQMRRFSKFRRQARAERKQSIEKRRRIFDMMRRAGIIRVSREDRVWL